MNDFNDNTTCNRADDLISVLYGEASEREVSEFRVHMQTCAGCEAEMRAFGGVRESIGAWKFEALSVAPAPEVSVHAQRARAKSAIAALREFFDLSPLWLKGATAFAALLLCLLAVLAFAKFQQPVSTTAVNNKPNAVYTEQEKDQILKKALDEQKAQLLATRIPAPESVKPVPVNQPQKTANRSNATNVARGQRPLTKWEREQLAADLRLLQRDDADIELLSEPINK